MSSDIATSAGLIPEHPDTLLTRERVASALTAAGFPVKPKTLSTKASRGGGPPYRRFGARALYRWGDALAWAHARLTAPQHSTSEGDMRERARHSTMASAAADSGAAESGDVVPIKRQGQHPQRV